MPFNSLALGSTFSLPQPLSTTNVESGGASAIRWGEDSAIAGTQTSATGRSAPGKSGFAAQLLTHHRRPVDEEHLIVPRATGLASQDTDGPVDEYQNTSTARPLPPSIDEPSLSVPGSAQPNDSVEIGAKPPGNVLPPTGTFLPTPDKPSAPASLSATIGQISLGFSEPSDLLVAGQTGVIGIAPPSPGATPQPQRRGKVSNANAAAELPATPSILASIKAPLSKSAQDHADAQFEESPRPPSDAHTPAPYSDLGASLKTSGNGVDRSGPSVSSQKANYNKSALVDSPNAHGEGPTFQEAGSAQETGVSERSTHGAIGLQQMAGAVPKLSAAHTAFPLGQTKTIDGFAAARKPIGIAGALSSSSEDTRSGPALTSKALNDRPLLSAGPYARYPASDAPLSDARPAASEAVAKAAAADIPQAATLSAPSQPLVAASGPGAAALPAPFSPSNALAGVGPLSPVVEQFVERIADVREAGRVSRPELRVRHSEFGTIGLKIEASATASVSDWRATLVARDPGFVPAVQAALADRGALIASEASSINGGAFAQRAGEGAAHASTSGFSGTSQGAGAGQDHGYGSSTGSGQGAAKPYSGEEESSGPTGAAASTDDNALNDPKDMQGGVLFA